LKILKEVEKKYRLGLIQRQRMASVAMDIRTLVFAILVLAVFVGGAYLLNPGYVGRLLGVREGFESVAGVLGSDSNDKETKTKDVPGSKQASANMNNPNAALSPNQAVNNIASTVANANSAPMGASEGFANLSDFEGPAGFGNAEQPAGCYPRDQLTPSELLPKDPNSVWAQQNPMGTGSLKGKNFLSAGALIGVNTVGQSLRNANYQLRSEPPNPQVAVSVFNQTTIEPDVNRRNLEIA
jgi:hypothetical protein